MQMKSKSGNDVRICLESGHTIIIRDEWRSIETIFLNECLARADVLMYKDDEVEDRSFERTSVLKETIKEMILNPKEGYFTKNGLPNVNEVKRKAGIEALKAEVYAIFDEVKEL